MPLVQYSAGPLESAKLMARFNVAITRAKELLIIVGNANLLKVSKHFTPRLARKLRV